MEHQPRTPRICPRLEKSQRMKITWPTLVPGNGNGIQWDSWPRYKEGEDLHNETRDGGLRMLGLKCLRVERFRWTA